MNIRHVLIIVGGLLPVLITPHSIEETKKNKHTCTGTTCKCGIQTCDVAKRHLTLKDVARHCKENLTTCIILDNNNVEALNFTLLKCFTKLKRLYCRNCNITNINHLTLFTPLSNITVLDLSNNSLSTDAFQNLFELVCFRFTKLSSLNLSGNRISDSSRLNFSLLKNISKLYLNRCNLSNISQVLYTNTINSKLLRLELEGNNIREESLGVLNKTGKFYLELNSLKLSRNPIKSLRSDVFSKLPKLQNLWLSNVQIGDNFNGTRSKTLKLLDVSYSLRLYSGEKYKNVFKLSPKINNLNLRGVDFNGYRNWTEDNLRTLFAPLKLKTLILANTSLKTIPNSVFNGMDNLAYLNLKHNGISNWRSQCFRKMSLKFRKLNLSNNKIETIKEDAFPKDLLERLQKLRLHGNIFRCDCSIHWFRTWMKGRYEKLDARFHEKHEEDMSYTCHLPPNLKGLKLVDFDPDYEFCHGLALSEMIALCIVICSVSSILVLNLFLERVCKSQFERLKFYH